MQPHRERGSDDSSELLQTFLVQNNGKYPTFIQIRHPRRTPIRFGGQFELFTISTFRFFDILVFGIWGLNVRITGFKRHVTPRSQTKSQNTGGGGGRRRGVAGAPHYSEGRPVCEHAHCPAPQPANRCTSAAARKYWVFLNLARFLIQPRLHSQNHPHVRS